jgi:hypothetical protein
MQFITRVDVENGKTLMWCGGKNFDLIQAQNKLRNAGMVIEEVREDKWAVINSVFSTAPATREEA